MKKAMNKRREAPMKEELRVVAPLRVFEASSKLLIEPRSKSGTGPGPGSEAAMTALRAAATKMTARTSFFISMADLANFRV